MLDVRTLRRECRGNLYGRIESDEQVEYLYDSANKHRPLCITCYPVTDQ